MVFILQISSEEPIVIDSDSQLSRSSSLRSESLIPTEPVPSNLMHCIKTFLSEVGKWNRRQSLTNNFEVTSVYQQFKLIFCDFRTSPSVSAVISELQYC